MTTTPVHPVTDTQARWLHDELERWQRDGLVDAEQANAIAGQYVAASGTRHRLSLGRLLLGLGAAFVGVSIIWLVAANLDNLSPVLRFAVVAGFWLLFLLSGEALAARGVSPPVVGAVRLIASLAFGATIFQAAQSMQVAAYTPDLLGLWAAGALLHAYATRASGPLLVGIVASLQWVVLTLWEADPSAVTALLAIGLFGVIAVSLGVLHDQRLRRFATLWRTFGVAVCLVALFVAAVPSVHSERLDITVWLVGMIVLAVAAVAAAVALTRGSPRLEPLAAVAVLAIGVVLVLWDAGDSVEQIGAADWMHAIVSVGVYVVVAVAVAALGTVRDNPVLTWIAMVALVVFTTFQSFAVFAAIIQGAWLFLVLGLIFLSTGFIFDRARRGLASTLVAASEKAHDEGDAR